MRCNTRPPSAPLTEAAVVPLRFRRKPPTDFPDSTEIPHNVPNSALGHLLGIAGQIEQGVHGLGLMRPSLRTRRRSLPASPNRHFRTAVRLARASPVNRLGDGVWQKHPVVPFCKPRQVGGPGPELAAHRTRPLAIGAVALRASRQKLGPPLVGILSPCRSVRSDYDEGRYRISGDSLSHWVHPRPGARATPGNFRGARFSAHAGRLPRRPRPTPSGCRRSGPDDQNLAKLVEELRRAAR